MTETELNDRLREQLILNGPDAWQSGDYRYQAAALGLSDEESTKRAATVRDEVLANSLLLDQIRARIARLIEPSRVHLYEQDLSKIINAAGSVRLSPDFVRNRWIPAEKARLAPVPPTPPPPDTTPTASAPEQIVTPEPVRPVAATPVIDVPTPVPIPVVEPPVTIVVSEPVAVRPTPVVPSGPPRASEPVLSAGPPPVVRSFTATPARVHKGQPVTLDWDVANLLAVTIDDLGPGLSPKNRGWVKPSKSTDYTLFDANNNPLSTVRVEVIPPDRSGLYGILFALALLAIIYWFIRSTNSRQPARRETTRQEETMNRPAEQSAAVQEPVATDDPAPVSTDTVSVPVSETPVTTATDQGKPAPAPEPAEEQATDTRTASADNVPASPADARQGRYEEAFGNDRFDKVELGEDDRGWRRARKDGRWGYIDPENNWVIQPRFEAITPFRNDVASAFLNGQLLKIDRSGEAVR